MVEPICFKYKILVYLSVGISSITMSLEFPCFKGCKNTVWYQIWPYHMAVEHTAT